MWKREPGFYYHSFPRQGHIKTPNRIEKTLAKAKTVQERGTTKTGKMELVITPFLDTQPFYEPSIGSTPILLNSCSENSFGESYFSAKVSL